MDALFQKPFAVGEHNPTARRFKTDAARQSAFLD